ncbi:MAG TPA: hypothetical protein EYP14_09385, partial [Planctomycetaceae bacterium]|nr:hypothetical protein [Planctomycetaceae bacterium]
MFELSLKDLAAKLLVLIQKLSKLTGLIGVAHQSRPIRPASIEDLQKALAVRSERLGVKPVGKLTGLKGGELLQLAEPDRKKAPVKPSIEIVQNVLPKLLFGGRLIVARDHYDLVRVSVFRPMNAPMVPIALKFQPTGLPRQRRCPTLSR